MIILSKPLVYQGLINGIPDVDSIFFQTRIKKMCKIDLHFPKIYPLIYFPGKYIPLNSKNTKYMYDIFPFIVLPTTINQEISDILRGYIIQRFAWGYNGSILYHTSDAYRNKSNNFLPLTYERERDIYIKLNNILNIINYQTKIKNNNPIDLLFSIIKNLIEKGIIKKKDFNVYKAFLEDLEQVGYKYSNTFSKNIKNYTAYLKIYSKLNLYLPSNQKNLILNCQNIKVINHKFSNKIYNNILLIINYNYPVLEKLNPYLVKLYHKNFNHIVFINPSKNITYNNTISCNNSFRGFYSYICFQEIYAKYPKFKGYLFINDDDFVKTWEFDNYNFNIPWFYTFGTLNIKWAGYNRCLKLYNIINNNKFYKKNIIKFLGYYDILTSIADFYYLPNSILPFFIKLMKKMYFHKIILECAVATSMGILLQPKNQLIYFSGLWGEDRKFVIDYLKKNFLQITIHPIKFSNIEYQKKVELYIFFINAKEY